MTVSTSDDYYYSPMRLFFLLPPFVVEPFDDVGDKPWHHCNLAEVVAR